ncbi:MAG: SCP2 sterol-binding domain-containing protein [Deinococcales bacterium]
MEKHELFSEAWASMAASVLAASTGYKKAAATWEGAMVFSLQADQSLGLPEAKSVFFDLWHGECRLAKAAQAADMENAQYIVSADALTWQQVLSGKLEPIAGLLRGKLKLSKGNMAVLARYVLAAKELVLCAASVPTKFPGE